MSVARAVRIAAELAAVVGLVVVFYDVTYEWLGVLLLGVAAVAWRNAKP